MPTSATERHLKIQLDELQRRHDILTRRIAALDTDLGRELDSERKLVLAERRAELAADRELVAAYLDALERGRPLPGLWPPAFQTADLLPPRPIQVSFKTGRCDFYRHVPLPPNYILRSELLAEVCAALLADADTLALTSAVKMDALHGMGGIGKSVLARALCDDPDVQTAFPDVILWATLGQTPDLVGRLREWIKASSLAPKYMPAVPIGRSSSPSSSARRRCSGCVGGGGFEPRDRSAVPVRAGLDSEPGSGA